MEMQTRQEQENLNRAKRKADIENNLGIVESAPQSSGALENPKKKLDGPYHRHLLQAAFRGDWEFAKEIFKENETLMTAKITERLETLLHIAALSAQDPFLKSLVDELPPEKLEEVDCDGRTALHNAVLCGRIRMVKALVRHHSKLTQLADGEGRVPLEISAAEASMHKEIAWFLAKETKDSAWFLAKKTPVDNQGHPAENTPDDLAENTPDDSDNAPDDLAEITPDDNQGHLAEKTPDDNQGLFFSSTSAIKIIQNLTKAGHHDITLHLVRKYPKLIDRKINKDARPLFILNKLARNESHFRSGTRLSVLEALIYKCIPVDLNNEPTNKNSDPAIPSEPGFLCKLIVALQSLTGSLWKATTIIVPTIKRIHEMKRRHEAAIKLSEKILDVISHRKVAGLLIKKDLLGEATMWGMTEILKLCIRSFPELIWIRSQCNQLVIRAVRCRQERTLRLFLKLSSTNKLSLVFAPSRTEARDMMIAAESNEVTEYYPNVGAKTKVAGVAFQMQREVQWYKAVESWVTPFEASIYKKGKTHWIKFVENHKELSEKAEKWMKDTANSCMLVSTLIATVLFTAAFTMPGGNNDKTGMPLLLGWDSFLVFAISDALGLFCSVTAVLLFLAILTSRYEAQDFLYSLPQKIIMGLSLLFLSLAFMLVAFAVALTMVLNKRLEWALIPITLLASVPMTLFAVLQLPLLFQMVKSTYGPSIFRPEAIEM